MRTRLYKLINRKSFTASDVIDKELKGNEVISFVDIIVRMTNGAAMTEASVVKIHDDISKIEVIDGGEVLVSANMEELQAINAYMSKAMPFQTLTLEDNAVQTEHCRIPFGFYPFDPNHYIRPADFDNLELKVHIEMTTAAATAWAAAGHDVTVVLGLIEFGFGDYKGFLSTKFVRNYTAVDGAEEIVEIPRDYPINAILIQAFKTCTRPDENIEIVKLTADNDAHVEVDLFATELEIQNALQFGRFTQKLAKRMKDAGDSVLGDLYFDTVAAAHGGTTLVATEVLSVDAESVVIETYGQT